MIAEESVAYASSDGLASDALAVTPAPATFKEFISLLLAAATDEDVRSEPHTEQLVDTGVYGRRGPNGEDLGGATVETKVVGTRTLDMRRRLDTRDTLFRVIPDLRSVVRTPKGQERLTVTIQVSSPKVESVERLRDVLSMHHGNEAARFLYLLETRPCL